MITLKVCEQKGGCSTFLGRARYYSVRGEVVAVPLCNDCPKREGNGGPDLMMQDGVVAPPQTLNWTDPEDEPLKASTRVGVGPTLDA